MTVQQSYLESRLVMDNNNIDEALLLAERVCKDPCSHADFATIVHKVRYHEYAVCYC